MINLKNYIIESIFDVEDNIDNVDESIKDKIRQFVIFKGLVVVSAYKYMVYMQILQEKLVY